MTRTQFAYASLCALPLPYLVANAVAFACCSFVQATVAAVSARAWALSFAFALAVTHFDFDFDFPFLTDLQATFAAALLEEPFLEVELRPGDRTGHGPD